MLSMCGLLCSMLRGWRHEQAVVLMARALAKTQSSLLIEDLSIDGEGGGTDEAGAGGPSPFCVDGGEGRLSQLLWRDNNKQAVILAPKQCVDLQRWTLFLSAENSGQAGYCPPANSEASSENGATPAEAEEIVTVLLEAAYKERNEEIGTDYHVMVEHLSRPYAWKAREVFGVIVTTTPPQLLAMIQAFFNNALLIDDDFLIKKLLTIETVGEPSTLEDPLSIPECVTPGLWSSDRAHFTQMEVARMARSASPAPQGQGRGVWSGQEGWRGNWLRPPPRMVPLWHQWSGESATSTSTTVQPQSSTDSERHHSSLDPQSSYDSVSDYPTSDADDTPCPVSSLYPRGWAVSGTRVVSGQPLSVRGALARGALAQHYKCSIVTNPLEELWHEREGQEKAGEDTCGGKQNLVCANGPASDHQQVRSHTLPRVKRGCGHPQLCLPSTALCRGLDQAPVVWRERDIVREAAEYYQRALNTAQEHREWIKKSTSSASEEEDFSFSSGRTDVVVTREPRKYPVRIRSEADLSHATSIIRDNLTNIVQNYLIKSGTSPSPEMQPLYPKLSKEHPTIKVLGVAEEADTDVQLSGKSVEHCSPISMLGDKNAPLLVKFEKPNIDNIAKAEKVVEVQDDHIEKTASETYSCRYTLENQCQIDQHPVVGTPIIRSSGRSEKKLTKGEEIVLPPITRDSHIDIEEEECQSISHVLQENQMDLVKYFGGSQRGVACFLKESKKSEAEVDSEVQHITLVQYPLMSKDERVMNVQEADQQGTVSTTFVEEDKSVIVHLDEGISVASVSTCERLDAKIPDSEITDNIVAKESSEIITSLPDASALLEDREPELAATESISTVKFCENENQKSTDRNLEFSQETKKNKLLKEVLPEGEAKNEVNYIDKFADLTISANEKPDDTEQPVIGISLLGTPSESYDNVNTIGVSGDQTINNCDTDGDVGQKLSTSTPECLPTVAYNPQLSATDTVESSKVSSASSIMWDQTADIPVIINGTQECESKIWEGLNNDQKTASVSWPGENEDLTANDDGDSSQKSKYLKDIHKLNTKSSTASDSSFESLPYRMYSSQQDSLTEDMLVIELTRPPPENERLKAARLELIRQDRIHAISLMASTFTESEDRCKSSSPEEEKKGIESSACCCTTISTTFTTTTVTSLQESPSTEAVSEDIPSAFWDTSFTSHTQEDSDSRLEAAGVHSEGGQQVLGSPVLDSGVELLEQETGHVSPEAIHPKSLTSPVESVPESGFSSLQEVSTQESVGEGKRIGMRGIGLCSSKSKDSLDLTDTDRMIGTDTLSDDMETLSSSVGDVTLVESGPVSQEGSSRGSISDPFHHEPVPSKSAIPGTANLVQNEYSAKEPILPHDLCRDKGTQQEASDVSSKLQTEQRTHQFSDSDSVSEMKISESLSSVDTVATRRSLDEDTIRLYPVEEPQILSSRRDFAGSTSGSERPESYSSSSVMINSKALHNSIADKLRLLSESEVLSEDSTSQYEIPSKKITCSPSTYETGSTRIVGQPIEADGVTSCRKDSKELERRIPNGSVKIVREGARSEQSERSSPSRHSSKSGISDLEDEVFLPPPPVTDINLPWEGASVPKMAASMFVPSTQAVKQVVRGSQEGMTGSAEGVVCSQEKVNNPVWESRHEEGLKGSQEKGINDDQEDVKGSQKDGVKGSLERELKGSQEKDIRYNQEEEVIGSQEEKVKDSQRREIKGSLEERVKGSHEDKLKGNKKKELMGRREDPEGRQEEGLKSSQEEGLKSSQEEVLKGSQEEGLKSSQEEGLKSSQEEGLKSSQEEGLKSSQEEGLKSSQEEGLKSSQEEGLKISQEEGLKSSQEEGLKSSQEEGLKSSQEEGLKSSQEEGLKSSQEEGLKSSQEEVLKGSQEEGLKSSQEEGLKSSQEEGVRASQDWERKSQKKGTMCKQEVVRDTKEGLKGSGNGVSATQKRRRIRREGEKSSQESNKGMWSSEEGKEDRGSPDRRESVPDTKPRLLRMAKLERVGSGTQVEASRTKQWVEEGTAEWCKNQDIPQSSRHHHIAPTHSPTPELRKCGSEEFSVTTITSTESSTSKSSQDPDLSSVDSALCVGGSLEYLEGSINGRQRQRSNTNPAISAAKSEDLSTRWERVSIKSQGSLDKFPHFDHVRGQPKPRGARRKVMSVDAQITHSHEHTKEMQRSVTLPAAAISTTIFPPLGKKEDKKKDKDEKSQKKKRKEKEKEGGGSGEKKSAILSLKGLLKRNKSKEKEKEKETSSQEKLSSPSLFRKFERKSKSGSHSPTPAVAKGASRQGNFNQSSAPVAIVDMTSPRNPVVANGKTRPVISGPVRIKTVVAPTTSSPASCSDSDSPAHSSPQASPQHRNGSPQHRANGSPQRWGGLTQPSPRLYKHVLTRHLSSSQESLDTGNSQLSSNHSSLPTSPHGSPRRVTLPNSASSLSLPASPPAPVMGTRALRGSSNSFSVTIGFRPQVQERQRTMSEGADLDIASQSPNTKRRNASRILTQLNKRSSSMEILVCGKIREHLPDTSQSPGKPRGSFSREGSFRLHREISVETLFEVPESEYGNYLEERHGSSWSLAGDANPHTYPRTSKLSLPHNVNLSGCREAAASNPNLQRCGSPLVRGLPHSASFTSSPFRRPHSTSAVFSPAKRGLSSSTGGTPASESNNGGVGGVTLMRVEEEEGPSRRNLDPITEKPPNVLVYAANKTEYFSAVRDTLTHCLNADRYIVYQLTDELAFKSPWCGSTTLLVVCGDVPAHISTAFIRYLLQGGRILSICSDFLNMAVPLFGTVEVQEQAVVSVSYKKWSSVQLLHHQHCFHSSPRHKRFSQEVDNARVEGARPGAVSVEPTHVEIIDEYGGRHRLDLKVLATDDTWAAPTLLSAKLHGGVGCAIFSQVHLERDPRECYSASPKPDPVKLPPSTTIRLATSNQARLEMLRDLLVTELGLDTSASATAAAPYTPAYFLGRHELKESLLNQLRPHLIGEELRRPNLTVQFVEPSSTPKQASEHLLPILTSACPLTFSTVKYFETLRTSSIGRLVIYSDVMTSSMKVTAGHPPLVHGIVVLPTQQTNGKGRGGNAWVSPLGCAMFSTQLHIALSSLLGQHLTFLQHLVALAVVQAVRDLPAYSHIPLALKWPNDIHLGPDVKIGGVVVEATTHGSQVIANVGCGVNLSNSNPTTCINDAVRQHNLDYTTSLPEIDRETFLARVFNTLEDLIETFQSRGPNAIQPQYYKYWLHSNTTVTVQSEQRRTEAAVIVGVDDFGFLQAQLVSGAIITLQPDGNSFNMMEGLIYAKCS